MDTTKNLRLLDTIVFEGVNLLFLTESKLRLSLFVPEEWSVGETESFQFVCVGEQEEGYRPNFTILMAIFNMPDIPPLEEIANSSLVSIGETYPEFKLYNQNKLELDSREAFTRTFGWQDTETGLEVQQQQTLCQRGRNLYTFSATSLGTSAAKNLKLMHKMLESITFN